MRIKHPQFGQIVNVKEVMYYDHAIARTGWEKDGALYRETAGWVVEEGDITIMKEPDGIIVEGVEPWSECGVEGWVKAEKYYLAGLGWREVSKGVIA